MFLPNMEITDWLFHKIDHSMREMSYGMKCMRMIRFLLVIPDFKREKEQDEKS